MSTKSFKLSNGETLDVKTFTGEILESNKTKHTSVHQERASVGANYVVPGQVYSEVHTEHEVWLRDAEGKEKAIDFRDLNVPIRVGHQVTVFYAGLEKAKSWRIVMIKNDTTGTWDKELELCNYLKANDSANSKGILKLLGIPAASFGGSYALSGYPILGELSGQVAGLGVLFAIAYFVYKFFSIGNRHKKVQKELAALMKSLAQA